MCSEEQGQGRLRGVGSMSPEGVAGSPISEISFASKLLTNNEQEVHDNFKDGDISEIGVDTGTRRRIYTSTVV